MLEIGQVIDNKYKILYEVGKGGMSRVYLAINEAAGKEWAVKEVRKNGRKHGESVKQDPVTETDILKKLDNPHLPRIIDVIEEENAYLIVMDFVEGRMSSAGHCSSATYWNICMRRILRSYTGT